MIACKTVFLQCQGWCFNGFLKEFLCSFMVEYTTVDTAKCILLSTAFYSSTQPQVLVSSSFYNVIFRCLNISEFCHSQSRSYNLSRFNHAVA